MSRRSIRAAAARSSRFCATSLEIRVGEYVAVVGPSGSGKTTLLSMLGGMLSPSTGRVWLGGDSLYDLSVGQRAQIRREKIGFVFQTFNLVPYLTALENVQSPALPRWRVDCGTAEASRCLAAAGWAWRQA